MNALLRDAHSLLVFNMKKTIIIFFVSFLYIVLSLVFAGQHTCGNGILEPGEYCDKNNVNGDKTWFNGIDSCIDVKADWTEGNLDCFPSKHPTECQLNVGDCRPSGPGGKACPECNKCDEGGSFDGTKCTQTECSYKCPKFGSCYYTPGHILKESCSSCTGDVNECLDYENELDCVANVCASNEKMLNKKCEWLGGKCKENLDCTWDCGGLYDNDPDEDGICKKKPGAVCELKSEKILGTCQGQNPANNYPAEIGCKDLQQEFPAFTSFNVFMVFILLVGYYLVQIRRKRLF